MGASIDGARGRIGALPCRLFLRGDSPHIRQVVSGFCELAAQGLVSLRVTGELRGEASEWRDPLSLRADIGGRRVIFDLNDGWYIPLEVRPYLDEAEFYFKRALDPARLKGMPAAVDVSPLGLNYLVTSRHNLWHRGLRPFDARRLVRGCARRASGLSRHFGTRDVRDLHIPDFEGPPTPDALARVLFMTRAWPASSPEESEYLRTDREAANELRAACIRAGRLEFGDRFLGGFSDDDFSRRHYGDCLLPTTTRHERFGLLARIRASAVCVSTNGLHDSIPWKMAVYVAASRAIVSEKLRYQVPGGFATGRNFLEFDTLDGFIAAIERLLDDTDSRADMMRENRDYYQRWVEPAAQVMRTLEHILGEGQESGRSA